MTEKTYAVGYGRPPQHAQFKKGKSGNPKGRPKGTLNLATVLERTLRDTVVVNEKGVRKTISKLQAAFTQLADKAASGDLKALQLWTSMVRSAEERASNGAVPNPVADAMDERVVLGILKRIEATDKEDFKNANEPISE